MKKDLFFYLIFSLLNIAVAYLITSLLNIKNIVVFKTHTLTFGDITCEVIIWLVLILIEGLIYEKIANKKRDKA